MKTSTGIMARKHLFTLLLSFVFLIFLASCGNNNSSDKKDGDTKDTAQKNQAKLNIKLNSDSVVDIDGNVYHTVTIGTQTWLAENLKTTKYRNKEKIALVAEYEKWPQLTSGAYCIYDNDKKNADLYGYLYNGFAVTDPRNIAPVGWHVATMEEWQVLIIFLGGDKIAGSKLKEVGKDHWKFPNSGATNEVSFTALPGGTRSSNGDCADIGETSNWWTATAVGASSLQKMSLFYGDYEVTHNDLEKTFGLSVRCVKD
jgi:uncharacterized protein (TIGR02145 family)